MTATSSAPTTLLNQVICSPRFFISCEMFAAGLGFAELAGINSAVEVAEYSYNSRLGNVHTKQFGRAKPPSITLKRAMDDVGFAELFGWHLLARANSPAAKVAATLTMMSLGGTSAVSYLLTNAWCAKLDVDTAAAGTNSTVMLRATIECDSILPG